MTVAIENDGKTVKTYTLAIRGDVNGDGMVTTFDARTVLGNISATDALAEWQKRAADFDRSDTVTTVDVRDLLLSVLV